MMRFVVLASGSRANCTFVESSSTCFLIDCGLSAREVKRRLIGRGIDPKSVGALIITHEHRDHIQGVSTLARQLGIPVYANFETSKFLDRGLDIRHFDFNQPIQLMDVSIEPFAVQHDAVNPVGLVMRSGDYSIAYCTDLGVVTESVRSACCGVRAIIIEANHDEELLKYSDYPWALKQRIASDYGHLSNRAACEFLRFLSLHGLEQVVLGHLSENCNSPDVALAAMQSSLELKDLQIEVATPYSATQIFGQIEQIELQMRDVSYGI